MSACDAFTVIMPVKMEREAIGPVIEELLEAGVDRGRIVVDGGSSDGTLEVLRRIEELNSRARVYVDPWPGKGFHESIRIATNRVRWRCED